MEFYKELAGYHVGQRVEVAPTEDNGLTLPCTGEVIRLFETRDFGYMQVRDAHWGDLRFIKIG